MSPKEAELRQKTILLIEGDDNYSFFYSKSLQSSFQVVWAHDGKQGLNLAGQLKPDLILLEIILKGDDGFEVLKKLKAGPETKKIPVAIITNLAHPEDREEAMRLGACEYILKTENHTQELLNKIDEIITGQAQ
jgi:DNA-binding response OmpR family regulator